ncbi:RimJ/RimL family protein N-acetyltransferase [Stackebrandtia endophytica]|uniref:RimJ/RimL family protein N-acetyltransferase n=1 Tax=Stackebrandtia endophytica TaxID=1496996 RepID=A0A543APR7_9ACTN|nr:GNAT family protein [Stackebrandtia endophytica]TQL74574.1 RimJ/RimL family protein N-acetyltransferase [Stackebrandtia endophytica]
MFSIALSDSAKLCPLEPWQAEEFLTHMDRARSNLDPWIPWASRSTDLASARAALQSYADRQAADAGRLFGIWRDGVLVGGVMFVSFNRNTGVCEIGVWLEKAAEGNGLISAAVSHLIDYAFDERGMSRIEWHTSPANERSNGVARRMGMRLEGTLREAFLHNGVRHDTEVWALLPSDRNR